MKAQSPGPLLSTIFIDYDNIYLSLKRKNEEAAKRFARDAGVWLREIESGSLITPTNALAVNTPRRIVMNRCYGNPVPRRNATDNATDMNSFPFVRHHFLRAGMEAVEPALEPEDLEGGHRTAGTRDEKDGGGQERKQLGQGQDQHAEPDQQQTDHQNPGRHAPRGLREKIRIEAKRHFKNTP